MFDEFSQTIIDELKQKAFSRGISNLAEGNFEILINLAQFF